MARSEAQKKADKKYEAKRNGKVHRVWWGYLYEDSAPADWLQQFRDSGYEGLTCKHDKDETATGEVKEAHWHVAIRFNHAKPRSEAVAVLKQFGVKSASVQYRDS